MFDKLKEKLRSKKKQAQKSTSKTHPVTLQPVPTKPSPSELASKHQAEQELKFNTSFLAAIARNDLRDVTWFLKQGARLTIMDGNSNSVLHIAVGLNNKVKIDVNILDCLLKAGANINATDANGDTPLHKACSSPKKYKIVERLLLEIPKLNVNLANNQGNTPLFFAVQRGDLRLMTMLLNAGSSFNAAESGEKLCKAAASSGNPEVLKLLESYGFNLDPVLTTDRLIYAIQHYQVDMVYFLLERHVNPNTRLVETDFPFIILIQKALTAAEASSFAKYMEIAQLLLTYGANINARTAKNATALILVSRSNMRSEKMLVQLFTFLLEAGADITARDNSYYSIFKTQNKTLLNLVLEKENELKKAGPRRAFLSAGLELPSGLPKYSESPLAFFLRLDRDRYCSERILHHADLLPKRHKKLSP